MKRVVASMALAVLAVGSQAQILKNDLLKVIRMVTFWRKWFMMTNGLLLM